MNRKLERNLVRIVGAWQIIDGLFTILLYGTLKKVEGAKLVEDSGFAYMKAMESYVGSIYIFIGMFGALLIGLGLINLVCAKKYMIDDQAHVKVAVWLFVCGALSYTIMDIISLVLCMAAGILVLAKNKTIRKLNSTRNEQIGGIN